MITVILGCIRVRVANFGEERLPSQGECGERDDSWVKISADVRRDVSLADRVIERQRWRRQHHVFAAVSLHHLEVYHMLG